MDYNSIVCLDCVLILAGAYEQKERITIVPSKYKLLSHATHILKVVTPIMGG